MNAYQQNLSITTPPNYDDFNPEDWVKVRMSLEDARAYLLLLPQQDLIHGLREMSIAMKLVPFLQVFGEYLPLLDHHNAAMGDLLELLDDDVFPCDLYYLMSDREREHIKGLPANVRLYSCPAATGRWLRWYLSPEEALENVDVTQKDIVFECLAPRNRIVLKYALKGPFVTPTSIKAFKQWMMTTAKRDRPH